MKRKLQLNRETLRNLASQDLNGIQGGAAGQPTQNQSCVQVCPTGNFSCGGTCVISHCIHQCPVAGTNPCIITIGG